MSAQRKPALKPAGKKASRKTIRSTPPAASANKIAAGAQRKSSFPLQDMIDAVGAGAYIVEADKIVSVSPLYEKMTGYSAPELIGSTLLDYIHPDDRDTVRKKKLKKLKAAGREPFEYRFIRKDGETVWFMEVSGPAARDEADALMGSVMDVTGLKPAADFATLQQDRYRAVLQEMGESYYETDLQGNLTFVNERLARTLGYSRKELLGMNYRQYSDRTTTEKIKKLYDRTYRTGKSFTGFEGIYVRKDGSVRHSEISGALMRDAQEKPAGFRCLSRDITQRTAMEEALRKSEERYRTTLEDMGEGYTELDLEGNWIFANNAAAGSLGYVPGQLVGMNFKQVTDEHTAKKMSELFDGLYQTGQPFKGEEAVFISRGGIRIIHEISGALMRDDRKKPFGFRLLSRDISSRKWAEEALLQSEAKYVSIIESIDAAFFETDLTGVITFANDKTCRELGFTRDELLRMSSAQLQDEDHARKTYDAFAQVYKTGAALKDFHYQVIRKDGTKADYELSISLIRDASGKPVGFRALSFDVTRKKRAEELIRKSEQSLREYSEKLEQNVKERTAELEKAKIAAEAASRAKSNFMASISHEFQTPLNAVIGFTKVLRDRMFGELNEKQDEFLRYIADAGMSLSRIITEILEASRVSSGGIKLNLSLVSLPGLLAKTSRMVDNLVREKKHAFTMNIEPEANIRVEADEQKIEQVVFHLFSNAVKYTAPGGKINVRAFRRKDASPGVDTVVIEVEDTGRGIKAEDIPRLFQAFGTLSSPYTPSGEGIGMGLALTRQLVEMHGGKIEVESEPGRGSRFTVCLPLTQKRQE